MLKGRLGRTIRRWLRRGTARARDGLGRRYASVAATLDRGALVGDEEPTSEDVMAELGRGAGPHMRLLGYYSAEGLQYALSRYGIFDYLRGLGYDAFRVAIDRDGPADRVRLFAGAGGAEHLLADCSLERQAVGDKKALFVRWLTLQDPHGRSEQRRASLPGQEEPGLGLGQEAAHLLLRAAARLGLDGIAFRPAWFHTAHAAARAGMCFVDPARQGRYEALVRDLSDLGLLEATRAIAARRVEMNGAPYVWEPDLMVSWLREPDEDAVAQERERVRFSVKPAALP